MRQVVYLKVLADTFYLDLIRNVTSDIILKSGFDKCEGYKLVSAVDEACANVIKHGYKNGAETMRRSDDGKMISLTYAARKDYVCVNLFDNGKEFNFKVKFNLKKHLQDMNPNGLGLYMIKSLVDKVYYKHIKGRGNLLRLIKYLNGSK